jgi:D-methionine transport system ATP-binding protein
MVLVSEIADGQVCGDHRLLRRGKSTVLRLVNALEAPTSGIGGDRRTRHHHGCASEELRALRGDIGMIFQQFNLFDSRTVAGNVA